MKRFQSIIQKYITNHQKHKKYLAAVLALSVLVSFGVSAGLIMPAVSMTKPSNNISKPMMYAEAGTSNAGNIPSGAIDIGSSITNVEQLNPGVQVVDGIKDIKFLMEFQLADSQNPESLRSDCYYLKLPKGEIDVTQDYFEDDNGNALIVSDDTAEWKSYKRAHGISASMQAGTYKIYKTADDFALICINWYPEYVDYIVASAGVKGSLSFDGKVGRDETQEGDKTVNVGNEQITIDFEPANLSLSKEGQQLNPENSELYVRWTVTIKDLYELGNYPFIDSMLDGTHEVRNFNCTPSDVFKYDPTWGIVSLKGSTSADTITITYETKVTPEEIIAGKVKNECYIDGTNISAEKEVEFNVSSKAHIEKSGKPSYKIEDEKGYIEWTIDVYRDFGLNLDGYTITDEMLTSGGIISIVDDKGNDITEKCNVSDKKLIFNDNINLNKATIKYKTEVTPNTIVSAENKAYIYPPDKPDTPDGETPGIPVDYDDTNLFNVEKTGSFHADDSGDNDYIEWQITIDATSNSDSKINLNGYTINDDAFSRSDCEITKVEAWNNGSWINNASKDTLLSQSGSTYTVKSIDNSFEVDKLVLTYKVNLTQAEKELRNNLNQGDTVKVNNTVTVTPDDGGPKGGTGTVEVPGATGSMSVSANKNWVGNDPNKQADESKKVTLELWQKLGEDGTWVKKDEQEVNAGETYKWENLPERDNSKKVYYYKVEEKTPPEDYTVSSNYPDGVSSKQNGTNPTITITNTWNKVNMGVVKNWSGIDDADKPDEIKFRLEKSTDHNNWTEVQIITLTKSNGYTDSNFNPVPKKDGDSTLYYRVVELDKNGDSITDFDVNYNGTEWGIDVLNRTDDYYFTVNNTWKNMNVSVNKSWSGDEGHESERPTFITLTLWQKIGDNEWESTGKTANINSSDYNNDVKCFSNLPKTIDGQSVQYKVVETPVSGYYVSGEDTSLNNTGTIHLTNNYSMMQVNAVKQWNNVPEAEKPADITFRLMWSSDAWENDETKWYKVEGKEDITVTKDADGNFPEVSWDNLPKRDQYNKPIYYKVIEVGNDDFTASYNIENNNTGAKGINENGKFIITNSWNYMNLMVNKTWNDNNNSELRPDEIVLTLKKRIGNSLWSDITADDRNGLWKDVEPVITLKKSGDKYYVNGDTTKPADSYEWKKLPARNEYGYSVSYKVEETPVLGYDVHYSSSSVDNSGTFNITNTSNFIDVTVSKGWQDVNSNQKPDTVTFKLMRSVEPDNENSWEELNDTEKTLTINKNSDYSSLEWKNLPGKDISGRRYYYKVTELKVMKDGKDVTSEYEMSCSPNNASIDNSNIAVTNTWKKMNLSVRKVWDGFDNIPETSVTVRLQQKIGESGTWDYVSDAQEVTLTSNDTASWQFDDAWTGLPKTTEDGQLIYYRAVENIPENASYYAVYDEVGKNSSDYSTITNKSNFINITVKKVWEPETPSYATKANSVTFYLQKTDNGGASWSYVDINKSGSLDDGDKITLDEDEFSTGKAWSNLPVKDGNTDIIYRVVEEAVDGFSASYSIDGTNFESNVNVYETKTVTVKNTENSPYRKFSISPSPNEVASDGRVSSYDKTPVSSFKPEQLANQIKVIDGKEYYIFKWYIHLEKNQTNNGYSRPMDYYFEDTLPKDTILYNSGSEYCVCKENRTSIGTFDIMTRKDELSQVTNNDAYFYDENSGKIYFGASTSTSCVAYYTATLKSTVDTELEKNGSYVLENTIQEKNEKAPSIAVITVGNDEDADYINKQNNTPSAFAGKAYYALDINKDGRFLSNGKTVNLTDVFHIIRYQPKDGEEQQGRNLLDASIDSVTVYEVDSNGRKIPISDYSYATEVKDGNYVTEKACSIIVNNHINPTGGQMVQFATWGNVGYPKGLEAEIQFTGAEPNAEIKFDQNTSYTVQLDGKDVMKLEALDTHFDNNGKGRIKLTVLDDIPAAKEICFVGINGLKTGAERSVLSQSIKQNDPVTDNIFNLTVPDGKHLIVEYEYSIKKTDGTALSAGDAVTIGNSATIHTSGGDKTSTSDESKFTMIDTSAQSSAVMIPKIKKIDSGNYSIENLKATFRLAKWNGSGWDYAIDFPFAESTDKKGNTIISATDHEIEYGTSNFEEAGDLKIESGTYNIRLAEKTLYKLVEIKAPDGYIKTPYEQGKTSESDSANSTYYFMYDGALTDIEGNPGVDNSKIQQIQSLGTVSIGNTKPIKIGAEKIWEQLPVTDNIDGVRIQVQLFSSATKSADIPADAKAVANAKDYASDTAELAMFDNDGRFTVKADYDSDTKSYLWKQDVIWENLPNGADGRPIYYYVKEVAYTIGDVTYELTSDGSYKKQGTDIVGDYKPTYTNNGINEDGIVTMSNSKRFLVKKIWMNLDGTVMREPPEMDIEFTLTGYTADGAEVPIALGSNNKLNASNNWQVEIPQSLVGQYVRFKIKEVNPPYFYTISDVYELNGTVGTVSLINQDKSISKVDVQVEKKWGDGSDVHKNDEITVTLYKSTSYYNSEQIKSFEKGVPPTLKLVGTTDPENPVMNPQKLNSENNWSYTWTGLPYKENASNGETRVIYYYAIETAKSITGEDKYVSSYNYINKGGSLQQMEITNTLPGSLTIKKKWFNNNGEELNSGTPKQVEVELYRQTVTTANSSSPTTTTTTANVSKQPIKLMAMGDSITDGYNIDGAYRQYLYKDLVNLYGYHDDNNASLIDMVGTKGWTGDKDYDDNNEGYSGYAIMKYSTQNRSGLYETIVEKNTVSTNKPDVILLMIGTNDILDNQMGTITGNANYNDKNIKERLEILVNYIYSQYGENDKKPVLFIANPTPLDQLSMQDYLYNSFNMTTEQKQKLYDDNIEKYSQYIQEIVNANKSNGRNVVYLDVNKELTLDDLREDGIHPTAGGFEKMGHYFAKQIASYLQTGHLAEDDKPEQGGEESGGNTGTDTNDGELVKTITIKAGDGWSYSFTDLPAYDDDGNKYVYYIKEVNGEQYDVEYVNNGGQSLDNAEIITIKNTTEGKAVSVTATKKWETYDIDGVNVPEQVGFQLMSSSVENGTPEVVSGYDIQYANADNNWTVTWDGLPASKYYSVKEIVPDGWTETSNTQTKDDDGNVTVEITNSIDKGNLEVEKSWYQDNDGENTSVDVELWRISEDKANSGTPKMPTRSRARAKSVARDATPTKKLAGSISNPSYQLYGYGDKIDISSICKDKDITSIEIELNNPFDSNSHIDVLVVKNGTNYVTGYISDVNNLNIDSQKKIITFTANDFVLQWQSSLIDSLKDLSAMQLNFYPGSNIKEIRFYYTPSETLEIECNGKKADIDNKTITGVSMTAGDTLTITANNPIGSVNWSSSDESVATVDGGVVTAKSAESAKNVTITAKDDTAERKVEITVNPFWIVQDNGSKLDAIELTESSEYTFKSNASSGNVTWSKVGESDSTNSNIDAGTGKFTAGQMGTVRIKANNNGVESNAVEVTINSRDFHFNSETCLMHISSSEKSFSLFDDSNASVTGNIEWTVTSEPDGILDYSTSDSSITVKAKQNGTAHITAKRGDKEANLTLTVAPLTISDEKMQLTINESKTLTVNNYIGTPVWSSSNDAIVSVDQNGTIETHSEGTAVITVEDEDGGKAKCEIEVKISEQVVSVPTGADKIGTATISKVEGWKHTWTDLPLTDGNGHKYIYYIKETSTGNYIPISYSKNGIQLEKSDVKTLTITNKVNTGEKPVTMPSTGGKGVTWYYITGAGIMLCAVVVLVRRRRRSA